VKLIPLGALLLATAAMQAQPPAAPTAEPDKQFRVDAGTRIPLNLINSISTRSAAPGDRVYLETAFPVVVDGAIVIPPGSYVAGTVTSVKRAGRVKGRAELFVRFDSLTLPNGVTRDFRGTVDKLDGTNSEQLDKDEGVIRGDSNKGDDAVRVAETAGWGTTAGALAGRSARGAGIGAAAGATAGLVGVLLTRGPDAVLERGTTIEMVLDRPVQFQQTELEFGNYQSRPLTSGPGEQPRRRGWMGRY
jgi:type IV secretory pathway VirB10-like protein